MPRRLAALLLSCLVLAASPTMAADYFGRPEPSADGSARAAPTTLPGMPSPLEAIPAPLRPVLGGLASLQTRLNAELRSHLRDARDGRSWEPAAAIVLFSFLYGVFHAVGPGHGKMVVGSYFLSRRARLLLGLSMSASAALVQALSAILLVGALAVLFDLGSRAVLDQAARLETVSYAVIVILGLWMGIGVLKGRACCQHDHGSAHDHHDHCDAHDHHDDHDHHDHHGRGNGDGAAEHRREWLHVLLTGAAVGLRPCSGAILVLLFTRAFGIFGIGVLATFAMASGVAITVAIVSLGAQGLQRGLSRLGPADGALAPRLRKGVALAGAGLITAFGLLQLLGIWLGLIVPMAG